MSTLNAAPASPLTTIFTPPSGCFESLGPSHTWHPCGQPRQGKDCGDTAVCSITCVRPQSHRCFPTGASVLREDLEYVYETFTSQTYGYSYSPGVLPSGFEVQLTTVDGSGKTTAYGCLRNWTLQSPGWCTSKAGGWYSVLWTGSVSAAHAGRFSAILPMIQVKWDASDLSKFTPASAPVLPTQTILEYESSVAARSRSLKSSNAESTKSSTTGSGSSSLPSNGPSSHSGGTNLSAAAKAGIGVGIAITFLLLLAFGLLFRRWKRRKAKEGSLKPHGGESQRPYLDTKAELEGARTRYADAAELGPDGERQELSGYQEPHEPPASEAPQEVAVDREPQEVPAEERPQELATVEQVRELAADRYTHRDPQSS